MKVITNDKLIKRNGRLGQVATISGLIVLVGGMFVSFRYPAYSIIAWIALLVGFGLSQIGLYFGNRWGRRPRLDEQIDLGLKGLSDQFFIYHYTTPASHLLVGPSGLWVIVPYYQKGNIVYEKGRWRQRGGGFMQKYLRLFAQEGIGRPDLEAPAELESLNKFFQKTVPDKSIPEARVVLVFTNENADLDVEDAPILSLPLKKLKEAIRKTPKEYALSPLLIQEINSIFS
jgi:hypothetical protein